MSALSSWSWDYDGWIVLAGILCAVAASLPGNFLLLRRMSLLGDAISHAILPGLAVAFLITGSRSSLPMFLGAVVVGLLTAVFTEWIRNFGEVDEGASMGVVFTTLFALGLVMIVQAADHVAGDHNLRHGGNRRDGSASCGSSSVSRDPDESSGCCALLQRVEAQRL
jgi:manganese/zinc/iron transport system permease protein